VIKPDPGEGKPAAAAPPSLDFQQKRVDSTPRSDDSGAELVLGNQLCRQLTQSYARTFFFASHCLSRSTRTNAYAVYAFCRTADNAVDEAATLEQARQRIQQIHIDLEKVYGDDQVSPMLRAFRQTVKDRGIPRDLFDALLDGMDMDLYKTRYSTYEELDLYCYRVAGVVGLMMTHLFGFRSERCFPNAVALGRAMQLTNILRDIKEDLERDRIYLPQNELARFGVTEADLASGRVTEPFRDLMRFQIDRARSAYQEAESGISDILGRTNRLTVRVMGKLYGGILNAIERQDYDVFTARARVSMPRKLVGLSQCLGRELLGS
jgi:phytoene synthase